MNPLLQSISAINAYQKTNEQIDLALTGNIASAGFVSVDHTSAPDFSNVMAQMAGSTIDKLDRAETISLKAVQGEANTREVVDALMTAEQSLNTAIAIRDKIVTAYLDVTRMQI